MVFKKVILLLAAAMLFFSCEKDELRYVSNVNIVDVQTGNITTNQFIEINHGIISRISSMAELPGALTDVTDGKSMYVTPGLTDMYVYFNSKSADLEFWKIHTGDRLIAAGVTGIREGGLKGITADFVENIDEYRGDKTSGPDIVPCLYVNYSTAKYYESVSNDMEALNAGYIKLQRKIRSPEFENILKYAEEQNIYSSATLYSIGEFYTAVSLGLDEINKTAIIGLFLMDQETSDRVNWIDEEETWIAMDEYFSKYYQLTDTELIEILKDKLDEVLRTMASNNMALSTCLAADEISAMKITSPDKYLEYAEKYKIPKYRDRIFIFNRQVYGDHFRLEAVPEHVIFRYRLDRLLLKLFHEYEITLLAGTELSQQSWYGLAPGISLHDEMRILTENGYSNLQALQTATLNPSETFIKMGIEQKRGLIKAGYTADLVFTAENPLEDLSVLREPVSVMKSGDVYNEDILHLLR